MQIGSGAALALGVSLCHFVQPEPSWLTSGFKAAYILSPPAKKHAREKVEAATERYDKAIPPPSKEEKEPEPELMKDSEGNEEDVSKSMEQSFVRIFIIFAVQLFK